MRRLSPTPQLREADDVSLIMSQVRNSVISLRRRSVCGKRVDATATSPHAEVTVIQESSSPHANIACDRGQPPSGGSSRQRPVLGPSTRTEKDSCRDEEVREAKSYGSRLPNCYCASQKMHEAQETGRIGGGVYMCVAGLKAIDVVWTEEPDPHFKA